MTLVAVPSTSRVVVGNVSSGTPTAILATVVTFISNGMARRTKSPKRCHNYHEKREAHTGRYLCKTHAKGSYRCV